MSDIEEYYGIYGDPDSLMDAMNADEDDAYDDGPCQYYEPPESDKRAEKLRNMIDSIDNEADLELLTKVVEQIAEVRSSAKTISNIISAIASTDNKYDSWYMTLLVHKSYELQRKNHPELYVPIKPRDIPF